MQSLITTDKTSSISITRKADIDENPIAYYEKKKFTELKYWIFGFNAFKADYNDELNAAFASNESRWNQWIGFRFKI